MESWHRVHFLLQKHFLLIFQWSAVISVQVGGVCRKCFGRSKLQFDWGMSMNESWFHPSVCCCERSSSLVLPPWLLQTTGSWKYSTEPLLGWFQSYWPCRSFHLWAVPALLLGSGWFVSRLCGACSPQPRINVLSNEQSAANAWAVPRQLPVQVLKMQKLAGVKCVLQKILRGRLMAAIPVVHQPCTGACGAHKRLQAATKSGTTHPCPFFILFQRLQPNWNLWPDIVVVFLCCSSWKNSVTKPLTKAMGFDVVNQRIAEKDKIIPVSWKRSVPKEQLQLQVHRSLAASQPLWLSLVYWLLPTVAETVWGWRLRHCEMALWLLTV